MWNKIKKFGYLLSARYVFLGTILAVFVFQFVTISMSNQKLAFNSLIDIRTMILVVSGVVGVFAGGLVQVIMSISDKNREQNDYKLWVVLRENKWTVILIRYVFGFSIGGFVGLLTKKILETNIDNEFFQALFSNENIIDCFGIVLAASVFGLLYALGTIKRLKLIYGH